MGILEYTTQKLNILLVSQQKRYRHLFLLFYIEFCVILWYITRPWYTRKYKHLRNKEYGLANIKQGSLIILGDENGENT
jgi:hypothetical protein